jgi:hypothetical protein
MGEPYGTVRRFMVLEVNFGLEQTVEPNLWN